MRTIIRLCICMFFHKQYSFRLQTQICSVDSPSQAICQLVLNSVSGSRKTHQSSFALQKEETLVNERYKSVQEGLVHLKDSFNTEMY